MPSKKKRPRTQPTIHPKNKYSDNPPDFALLASLHPTFEPFVFYSRDGRPRIDWTDFNATRELTRVLLLHDHGLNWWIPDGQLCPTVPNRSNYIHWIEDLLSSNIIPSTDTNGNGVKGFDIGTGANCIYPLLGASLLGWSFVGSDVTDVALEWAEKNVKSNPHISALIEIRKAGNGENNYKEIPDDDELGIRENKIDKSESVTEVTSQDQRVATNEKYYGPPILLDVVKDGESFDFCMCNPPFFESMDESGLNPKTSCGGTPQEMVCPGGEKAFISRIIEDSAILKLSFRWYTSMIGRKANLKLLISKLREVGVTIVKTTEFVQGQTCRWGLAWSFVAPARKIISPHVAVKNNLSFMLEGLERQFGAINVLQSVESFFNTRGASSKLNDTSFTVDITSSNDHCDSIPKNKVQHFEEPGSSKSSSSLQQPSLRFRVSVFQQIPGTLLVKGSLHKECPPSGAFTSELQELEEFLRSKFCRNRHV